ncbi:hypothetical protein [Anaplasma marginale]|nr:hypothetical protein [Anaplasma marginale]
MIVLLCRMVLLVMGGHHSSGVSVASAVTVADDTISGVENSSPD